MIFVPECITKWSFYTLPVTALYSTLLDRLNLTAVWNVRVEGYLRNISGTDDKNSYLRKIKKNY